MKPELMASFTQSRHLVKNVLRFHLILSRAFIELIHALCTHTVKLVVEIMVPLDPSRTGMINEVWLPVRFALTDKK